MLSTLAAVIEGWQAADIVWSMWAASLVSGYVMIVAIIVAGILRGSNPASGDDDASLRARLAGGLWMLAFFSFHFLFFHAGHAMFTQLFFPANIMDIVNM